MENQENSKLESNYKLRFLDDDGNSYPDWEEIKLSEVIIKNKLKNKKNDYFPVETISNKFGFIKQSDYFNKDIASINKNNYYIVKQGIIAYNPSRINVGSIALKKTNYNSLISPLYINFYCDTIKLNPFFLINYFKTKVFYSNRLKFTNKGVRENFIYEELKKLNFLLPSLPEQQKIGSFLSKIDDYIKLQKEEIILTKEYKKSLLEQIFNQQIKVLDENGNNYSKWKEQKIKDIFEVARGPMLIKNQMKKEKSEDYIFPVYSSQTSNNGVIGYYNQYLFENAITWTTDGYYAGDFNYRNEKFYVTTHCGILINNKGYCNEFIGEFLNKKAKSYVIKLAQPMLQKNIVMEISLSFPSYLESQKLGNLFSSINQQISQLELEYKNLNEYKNVLLNKLIF